MKLCLVAILGGIVLEQDLINEGQERGESKMKLYVDLEHWISEHIPRFVIIRRILKMFAL